MSHKTRFTLKQAFNQIDCMGLVCLYSLCDFIQVAFDLTITKVRSMSNCHVFLAVTWWSYCFIFNRFFPSQRNHFNFDNQINPSFYEKYFLIVASTFSLDLRFGILLDWFDRCKMRIWIESVDWITKLNVYEARVKHWNILEQLERARFSFFFCQFYLFLLTSVLNQFSLNANGVDFQSTRLMSRNFGVLSKIIIIIHSYWHINPWQTRSICQMEHFY